MNWRLVAVSVEGASLDVDGVDIWRRPWRDADVDRVPVSDPQYGQQHLARVYEIDAAGRTIRFAAVEFSNQVWGVYRPG